MTAYKLIRTGRTYSIVRSADREIVEGGFFSKEAALDALATWNAETPTIPAREELYCDHATGMLYDPTDPAMDTVAKRAAVDGLRNV